MNARWTRKRAPLRLGWVREFSRAVLTTALLFAVLWAAGELWLRWSSSDAVDGNGVDPSRSAVEVLATRRQLERIDTAIRVYRLRHGVWPESLEAVIAEGLLAEASVRETGSTRPCFYLPAGTEYVLLPPAY